MEVQVQILSKEYIKPASSSINKKPYKLSLFDHLTPTTYSPTIFFYSKNDQTNIRLSDFFKHHQIEELNCFLSCQPYQREVENNIPLLQVQLTSFTCGGIALGICASHKLIDGPTAWAFLSSWASTCRGDFGNVIRPNLEQASEYFPPRDSLPENQLALMETSWFSEASYVTRRFVFNTNAIATLRANAEGALEKQPTRNETLSCFIWKCCMNATKAFYSIVKPSILLEAVNLRPLTNPPMSDAAMGNLFSWALAVVDPNDENETELAELMKLLSGSIALYKTDFTKSLQGEEGFKTISDSLSQLEDLFVVEKLDIFAFTNWCYFGFNRMNFGWGEPIWTGILGKAGSSFQNLTIFIDTLDGKGIEAWITLDEQRMSLLEKDPNFLEFASPNLKISTL